LGAGGVIIAASAAWRAGRDTRTRLQVRAMRAVRRGTERMEEKFVIMVEGDVEN
jgi:hypothetical protein